MPVPDTALAEAALANRAAPDRGALPLSVSGLRVVAGGRTILDIPSLEVAAGALIVLRGASGAGKSTALNVLSGNMAAQAGRVRWGATDIAALPPSGRRRFRRERLGLLFQDYRLFAELGALDNAALPAPGHPRRAARGCAPPPALRWTGWVWPTPPVAPSRSCRGASGSGSRWPARCPPDRP